MAQKQPRSSHRLKMQNAAVAEAVLAKQACRELASARKIYPWLSPPLSSRTMEPTKFLASPNSIRVLSR